MIVLTLLVGYGTFLAISGPKVATMSFRAIGIESTKHQLLRERLLIDYPSLDEETLRDTLEGITELNEMIAAVIRSALVDEALQAGLRTRLEEMRQRLTRFEERNAKKRHLALEAMTEVGLSKLEQPDFTASARRGSPALFFVSEHLIPRGYWIPQPPKLDRQALLAALKRGISVPGADLGNPKPTLSVRTK
jgi:hypothetical protein